MFWVVACSTANSIDDVSGYNVMVMMYQVIMLMLWYNGC